MFESPARSLLSLYLHIPFCTTRCTYCAFNTYTNMETLIPAYVDAMRHELSLLGEQTPEPLHTIYFGGGTPSMLSPDQIALLLDTCRTHFNVLPDAEITMEANPGSDLNCDYFERVRVAGVNRLSFGMQSAQSSELRMFARQHSVEDVATCIRQARSAGFDNISLDLIFGLPGQTLQMWQDSLNTALTMQPDHLSLYALILEPGTALTRQITDHVLPTPDDDLAADMYELADSTLQSAGLVQYEISNWARPGAECLHNIQYWRNLPYLGVGAGAHGYAAGIRYEVVKPIQRYIDLATSHTAPLHYPLTPSVEHCEPIDTSNAMAEHMMTGLRLVQEGISITDFEARFGVSIWDVYNKELNQLLGYGLLVQSGDVIRLAPHARLLSNQVFMQFMQS